MNKNSDYQKDSLSLIGAISLGTGVMIGAGIFSLTGQMAEIAGEMFPFAFLAAAIAVSFSSYSYVKLSRAFPSAGGIGMFLHKAYGTSVSTAFHALLMYFSMVIAQSFLARTFGAYSAQLFELPSEGQAITVISLLVVLFAFGLNLLRNSWIQGVASVLSFIKVLGITIFAIVGVSITGGNTVSPEIGLVDASISNFLAATALGILAFKGFTTITNSGAEVTNPHKNIGRAIVISIGICIVVYVLVGFAVSSNLSLSEIIESKNYSLAAAARPVFGDYGVAFTSILAMTATVGGIIASIFAVSRMLAMLSEMKLVPHSHFGMPGDIQKHTLVYTIVIALLLTAFFDLSRIAALGIIFYLIMDIAIHWGVLRHLQNEVKASVSVLLIAILLDMIILIAFVSVKLHTDSFILIVAGSMMLVIWVVELIYLRSTSSNKKANHH